MRAGMERANFGTWDPVQHIFTNINDSHNQKKMTEIFQVTGHTYEDLENDPEAIRTKRLTTFNDADLVKAYARAQVQDD